jgi:hypothetical protein
MKLTVSIQEILTMLFDENRYAMDCGHRYHDANCCSCQSKRVLAAWDNGELEVDAQGQLIEIPSRRAKKERAI